MLGNTITKVTILKIGFGFWYLTDPIHSIQRYSNHNGFLDVPYLPARTRRGSAEGPGSIRITLLSGNHPGIYQEV